jgi:hypothetical protein
MKRIEFIEHRTSYAPFVLNDEWQFKPAGHFQWLQRAAWKLLHRLGALHNAIGQRETVTRHVIDPDNFMQKLHEQQSALFGQLDREGKTLLIGAEDYAEMMHSPEMRKEYSFRAEFHRGDRSGVRIMGLEVKVIPWIRGMVVMP